MREKKENLLKTGKLSLLIVIPVTKCSAVDAAAAKKVKNQTFGC